jgi:tetratricopeptide (TPR) repeat protein
MWTWDYSYSGFNRKGSSSARSMRGETCSRQETIQDSPAEDDLGAVMEMYHYANGTVLELNGYIEDAIREYRETVQICPAEGFYHYNLGVALLKNSQYNEAFKELTDAVRMDPEDLEAKCALADVHSALGQSLEAEGRLSEAADEYREAIAIDPHYADYRVCLGRALIETVKLSGAGPSDSGRLRSAIAELRTALRLDPECMEARLSLGIALTMAGSPRTVDEGIGLLNDLLRTDPLNDDARSCLDSAVRQKSLKGCS